MEWDLLSERSWSHLTADDESISYTLWTLVVVHFLPPPPPLQKDEGLNGWPPVQLRLEVGNGFVVVMGFVLKFCGCLGSFK